MSNPAWSQILQAMYEDEMYLNLEDAKDEEYDPIERLSSLTELDEDAVEETLEYMKEVDLVKDIEMATLEEGFDGVVGLTTHGFEVAHDREQQRQQQETNTEVKDFTAALVFVGLIQAISASFSAPREWITLWLLLLILVIAFSLVNWGTIWERFRRAAGI